MNFLFGVNEVFCCCCCSRSFSSSESSFRRVFLSQSYSPCRIWWRSLCRYFLSYPLFLFLPTSKHLKIYTYTQCKHVFLFNLSFYTFALLVNQILKCSVQTGVDIRRHLYNKARTKLLIVEYPYVCVCVCHKFRPRQQMFSMIFRHCIEWT